MRSESFVEICGECGKEYRVYYKRCSKKEQVAYCQHLCFPSHMTKGDGVVEDMFRALSVEFPVYLNPDLVGLGSTMRELDELSPAQWSILASVYGIKVGENTPRESVHNVIKGHVQREWYMAAKGEVKVSVQKNQETRAKEAAAPKKAKPENGGEEKKPRELKKYKLATGKAEEIKKLKGQAAQVVEAVKLVGAGDVKQVGAELAKNPEFKTRQTPERIAGYYFKMLSDQGILVQAQ